MRCSATIYEVFIFTNFFNIQSSPTHPYFHLYLQSRSPHTPFSRRAHRWSKRASSALAALQAFSNTHYTTRVNPHTPHSASSDRKVATQWAETIWNVSSKQKPRETQRASGTGVSKRAGNETKVCDNMKSQLSASSWQNISSLYCTYCVALWDVKWKYQVCTRLTPLTDKWSSLKVYLGLFSPHTVC